MAARSTQFGFLPHSLNCTAGQITIWDLPGLGQVIENVLGDEQVQKDWVYAPAQESRDFMTGEVTEHPYSARVFGLPKTHEIEHASADSAEHLSFMIWCLGFFLGIRLTDTEAGFLDATPVKTGKLTDFRLVRSNASDAIALAEDFWQRHAHRPRVTKRVAGIIHTLFLAQTPTHLTFEEFSYLYIALDACFALAKDVIGDPGRLPHARRLEWLCDQFVMPVPGWAAASSQSGTEVSVARNDAMHEALFFEEPLGFAIYGDNTTPGSAANVPLEMSALVCRFLVALLGKPDAEYVRTPVNTRQIHGLDLS